MKKHWDVTVNGVRHTIEYKAAFGIKIIVNGQIYKTRSQNWFINMVDYPIYIDGAELRVVAIGNKVDLAVNGIYEGSKEPYHELAKMPAWVGVLVGISVIGGWLLSGLLGMFIGVLFGVLYANAGLKGKTSQVVLSFAGCTAIQIVLMFVAGMLLYS